MTAPDAPKPSRTGESSIIFSALSTLLLIALAMIVGWFVGAAEAVPPAQHMIPASPVVIQGPPPFPAVLVQAAAAYVAHATETAPTPTATPGPPTPTATVDPTHFCGIDSVQGQVCRWPLPPAPTPTPYPSCGSPSPNDLCIWRES